MSAVKHIVSAAVIILILGGGTYFFLLTPRSHSDAMACLNSHVKIIAFGDSLVEGYGARKGNDFPTILGTKLGVPVSNFGHSGDTTADAFARVEQVTAAKPDIVILLLGGNDALQRVPIATTKQNLGMIIERLQTEHIRIVLVGVMGGVGTDPYKAMFENLAKKYHSTLVPNILSGLFGDPTYMSDEAHPNDAGYAQIAGRLAPTLITTCTSI